MPTTPTRLLSLRPAEAADALAIASLHAVSWQTAYRGLLPDEFLDALNPQERATHWQQLIAEGKVSVVVATADQQMVGFCAHGPSRDGDAEATTWEIHNLHVMPENKSSGIGTRLFEIGRTAATQHGATSVTLWVLEGNHPACRFYERRGMQADGGRKSITYAPNLAAWGIRYRLSLLSVARANGGQGALPPVMVGHPSRRDK